MNILRVTNGRVGSWYENFEGLEYPSYNVTDSGDYQVNRPVSSVGCFIRKEDCAIIYDTVHGEIASKRKPLNNQVGGGHYTSMKIQPVEYIHGNNLGFIEGCIVKYFSRWRDKNGVQDLHKIKHFVDLLIDLEDLEET